MVDSSTLVMQTLQNNWSLSSPGQTDVYWVSAKVEMMDWAKLGKNIVVACYSGSGPVQAVPLSAEVWQKTEQVTVDIIVKVGTGTAEDANTIRDSMATEVYRIIHSSQFTISGISAVYVSRESFKVESAELSRLALQVSCVSFNISS